MNSVQTNAQGEAYSLVTGDFNVTVEPAFVEERSDISSGVYVFLYKVTIENKGSEAAQLINRHWKVFSGDRQVADVKGEGVIGEQPLIEPQASFEYTSWTVIKDPIGSMVGSYTFRASSGEFFDIAIPRFELMYVDHRAVH